MKMCLRVILWRKMSKSAQKNLFVAAGAGTGKTTRLAQEYLKRLLVLWLKQQFADGRLSACPAQAGKKEKFAAEPEPVEQLLAITFTEKASSEMKTRILKLAQKIQRGDSSELVKNITDSLLDSISSFIQNPELGEKALADFLTYLKKNLHKGDISTIHAFCARILREHPMEAGVDPEFAILDEREAEQLLQNAVEKCALAQSETKTVSYLLQQMGLYGKSSYAGGLVENVTKFIKIMRSHGRTPSFLQEKVLKFFAAAENSGGDTLTHYHEAMQCFPLFIENVLDLYRYEKSKEHTLDYEDLQQFAYDVLRNYTDIRASLKQLFSFILVDEFQDINAFQRDIIFYLAEKRDCERQKTLDYGALENNVLFVVGDAKQSIYGFRGADVTVFEEARKRWDTLGWGKDVLKTNFRSRSPILDFVNEFFSDIMQGGEQPFEVPFIEEDKLNASSEKKLMSPQVFRLAPEEKAVSADRQAETQWKERENEAEAMARQIDALVMRNKEYFVMEGLKDTGRHNKRPVQYGDAVILLRSLSSIVIYQNALKAHDIPYHIVRGRGFYQSQEVLDVLNTLRAVLGHGDEISLCGYLRSQFVALSDDLLVKLKYKHVFLKNQGRAGGGNLYQHLTELTPDEAKTLCGNKEDEVGSVRERLLFAAETFRMLCALRDRLSPSELLVRLFDCLHVVPILYGLDGGEQKAANLYKLIEFARVYEIREGHTLHDFVKELERLYEKEPTEAEASLTSLNAVKIMTVHQAKGLEFPVVFVADMGWSHSFSSPALLFSPDEGFALKETDDETGVTEAGEFYKRMQKVNAQREQQEGYRIFYVACTRAKDYLFLCGERKGGRSGGGKSWSELVNTFKESHAGKNGERSLLEEVNYTSVETVHAAPVPTFFEQNKETLMSRRFSDLKEKHEKTASGETQIFEEKTFPLQHFTLSVTALANFFLCERKFYYESVLRLDGEVVAAAGVKAEKEKKVKAPAKDAVTAADAGTLAHKILQSIDFSASKKEVEAASGHLFGESWTAKQKKEVLSRLNAYLKLPFVKKLAALPPENIFREQSFFLHVEVGTNIHLYVSGIMDLLYEDAQGMHILDYKFAEYDVPHFELYKTQLELYALAVRNATGKLPADLHIAYLKEKKKTLVPVNLSGFSEFEQKLNDSAERLSVLLSRQNQNDFIRAERSACDALLCAFRPLCRTNVQA